MKINEYEMFLMSTNSFFYEGHSLILRATFFSVYELLLQFHPKTSFGGGFAIRLN